VPDSIAKALRIPAEARSTNQQAELTQYFRQKVDAKARKLDSKLAAHKKAEPKGPQLKAPILARNDPPRPTFVHVRGDFLRKGEQVQPATFAILHPLRARSREPDRLDLARWLFDPANPLTSRVIANRIWMHLFNRGLVNTPSDFGTRGDAPSHLELLDWLATELPRLGWSRKAFIRMIVTSATYRQASYGRPDLLDRDPDNILLARQNRFRLEAESVRDSFLACSGLLVEKIGGPGIRPPLPADITSIAYANSVKWKESEGADKYRRGLYIFMQRTVPYPMLTAFDAPDSNVSCTRRERSNTPLQALTLLNDQVFFEAAQSLAKEVAHQSTNRSASIRSLFKRCLGREPNAQELDRLLRFYDQQQKLLAANPSNAGKIMGVKDGSTPLVDSASLVAVARVVMNLDEFVTRE